MYKFAALQFSADPQLLQDYESLEVLWLGFVIFFRGVGGGGGLNPMPKRGMGGKHQGTNQCYRSPHPILSDDKSRVHCLTGLGA